MLFGQDLAYWRPIHAFHNALLHYIDVDCFIVQMEPEGWMALHRASRTMAQADITYWISEPERRWNYNSQALARLRRKPRTLLQRQSGFCDLFLPVVQRGRTVAAVAVGPFAERELSATDLRQIWLSAGGRHDAAYGDDFAYFCRTLVDTPVIEGEAFKAVRTLAELFARALSGEGSAAEIHSAMETVFFRDVCRLFYHTNWADRVIRQDRYFQSIWREGKVSDWEHRELGIETIPRRVIACAPAVPVLKDPVEVQIQAGRFQRAALRFTAGRRDVAAGKLADYGVLLLHAPTKSGQDDDRRAWLLARDFQEFIRAELGLAVYAGVGPREGKEHLYRSYQGALAALHRGVDQRKAISIPEPEGERAPDYETLARAEHALIDAMLNARRAEAQTARGQFVSIAHRLSSDRLEALRVHFQRLGHALLEQAVLLGRLDPGLRAEILARWFSALERATNTAETVQLFRTRLDEVAGLLERPQTGAKDLRFARAKSWTEANFQRDPSLRDVALAHGFSPSTFARELKRATGLSYSRWISGLRLKYAQELLENTSLSASAIASSAGFDSLSYFFQWYKHQTGFSPKQWRQKKRGAPALSD